MMNGTRQVFSRIVSRLRRFGRRRASVGAVEEVSVTQNPVASQRKGMHLTVYNPEDPPAYAARISTRGRKIWRGLTQPATQTKPPTYMSNNQDELLLQGQEGVTYNTVDREANLQAALSPRYQNDRRPDWQVNRSLPAEWHPEPSAQTSTGNFIRNRLPSPSPSMVSIHSGPPSVHSHVSIGSNWSF